MADELEGGDNVATPNPQEVNNLPSMVDEFNDVSGNFKLSEDYLKENIKDGKLFGRFENMEGVLNTLKAVETKHANFVRETKDGIKQTDAEIEQIQQQRETDTAKETAMVSLIPQVIENGMQLTPEVLAQAEANGIDPILLENQAMKAERVRVDAHALVGGADNYASMIDWAKNALSDSEREEFDAGLNSNFRSRLIKSLWSEFQSAGGEANQAPQEQGRFSGEASPRGIRGYATLPELLKDKGQAYGKTGSQAEKDMYNARFNATPDAVIYRRA